MFRTARPETHLRQRPQWSVFRPMRRTIRSAWWAVPAWAARSLQGRRASSKHRLERTGTRGIKEARPPAIPGASETVGRSRRRSRTGSLAEERQQSGPVSRASRNLLRIDQSVVTPPDREKPGTRSRHRHWANVRAAHMQFAAPAVEPSSRRCGIDLQAAPEPPCMAPGVEEHGGEGVPDFPRRSQDTRVKALGEDSPAPAERPVEREHHAGAERHHAAGERACVGCFDEQVSVCVLERVLNQPEVTAIAGRGEAALERANESHRT